MTIENTIKKLKNDRLWNRIYGKWRKRRQRNPNISFEECQRSALREYHTRFDFLEMLGKACMHAVTNQHR